MKKLMIINICKEKLHYYEFVKPIEDILRKNDIRYFIKNYNEIENRDILNSSRIIISGTSLIDNEFIKDIKKFEWIKTCSIPIFGICGGMQIIGLVFNGKIKNKTEIGFYKENFTKDFLGLIGESEVYHLHNNYVDFNSLKEFEIISGKKISQAIKHRKKEIYGTLFHPEVRQKKIIINFCNT